MICVINHTRCYKATQKVSLICKSIWVAIKIMASLPKQKTFNWPEKTFSQLQCTTYKWLETIKPRNTPQVTSPT